MAPRGCETPQWRTVKGQVLGPPSTVGGRPVVELGPVTGALKIDRYVTVTIRDLLSDDALARLVSRYEEGDFGSGQLGRAVYAVDTEETTVEVVLEDYDRLLGDEFAAREPDGTIWYGQRPHKRSPTNPRDTLGPQVISCATDHFSGASARQ